MKKKIVNVVQVILSVLALIILLCFTLASYKINNTFATQGGVLTFGDMFSALPALGIAVLALFICYIVMCAISISSSSQKVDSILHSILPIIILITTFIYGTLGTMNAEQVYDKSVDISMQPAWSVVLVLIFGIIILGFIKRSSIIVHPTSNEDTTSNNMTAINTSNADELKKYSDLLDSGVITQEEFDAKKKQLLGL